MHLSHFTISALLALPILALSIPQKQTLARDLSTAQIIQILRHPEEIAQDPSLLVDILESIPDNLPITFPIPSRYLPQEQHKKRDLSTAEIVQILRHPDEIAQDPALLTDILESIIANLPITTFSKNSSSTSTSTPAAQNKSSKLLQRAALAQTDYGAPEGVDIVVEQPFPRGIEPAKSPSPSRTKRDTDTDEVYLPDPIPEKIATPAVTGSPEVFSFLPAGIDEGVTPRA